MPASPRIGVVIVTRDRRRTLLQTLGRLAALPERPPTVVVDNASHDGTPEAVRATFPAVEVIDAGRNRGAAARTLGVRGLGVPYVAFCDDDSWWEPGALARAAALFDAFPRLGLQAATVLVGPRGRLDPVCAAMADSPLPGRPGGPPVPGRPVLGFVACGAVVRRDAFLAVGGFDERYGIGGEEALLALDLTAAGWDVSYVPELVAHHEPGVGAPRPGRIGRQVRNDLWSAWLRRPVRSAVRASAAVVGRGLRERRAETMRGTVAALRGAGWVLRERRVVPGDVERAVRTLERSSAVNAERRRVRTRRPPQRVCRRRRRARS